MITGTHLLLLSADPDADRAFFRDVLRFRSVDAGEGWLIFALPPAELGIHPADAKRRPARAEPAMSESVLYLMCDDVRAVVASLRARRVKCARIRKAPWGSSTIVALPGGGGIGLYQPSHPVAARLRSKRAR